MQIRDPNSDRSQGQKTLVAVLEKEGSDKGNRMRKEAL